MLQAVLLKVYQSSFSRVRVLTDKLEGLDLTTFPGENVTLLYEAAMLLVTEIQMCCRGENQVPDLTTKALSGLTTATDT